MSVNQAVIASLLARPVPPEAQCDLPQETANAIAQYITVVGLASQIASPTGVSTPVTNNVGQQALTLAQSLQETIQALQAQTIRRRIVASDTGVSAGNSKTPFTFGPPMPDTNYIVNVMFTTDVGHVTIPTWRVQKTTKTTTGFTLILDNVPADALITVTVEALANV